MIHAIIIFYLLANFGVHGQQCLNEYGEALDWYFLYKMPKLPQPNDLFLRKGLGYIFLTSKHPTSDWRLGMKSINDTKSMVGRTLSPIYNRTISDRLFYILYNDDPPNASVTLNYAHAKGAVISDGKTGIWLIHSSPRFPIEPFTVRKDNKAKVRSKKWNRYEYPISGTKYGQSFLCLSLNADGLNSVGNLLMYNRPKIYAVNIPSAIQDKFPNLTLAAKNVFIKGPPYNYKTKLTTTDGSHFTGYAKTKLYQKDLYSAFIAPDIQSNLEVESWKNGPGDLPSDCKGNYSVKNILDLGIRMEQNVTYKFKNSQDHSKWAVSDKDKSTICIGDINRMEPQLKRGGGSVCFRHPYIWGRYKKAVSEVEPCPKRY